MTEVIKCFSMCFQNSLTYKQSLKIFITLIAKYWVNKQDLGIGIVSLDHRNLQRKTSKEDSKRP